VGCGAAAAIAALRSWQKWRGGASPTAPRNAVVAARPDCESAGEARRALPLLPSLLPPLLLMRLLLLLPPPPLRPLPPPIGGMLDGPSERTALRNVGDGMRGDTRACAGMRLRLSCFESAERKVCEI